MKTFLGTLFLLVMPMMSVLAVPRVFPVPFIASRDQVLTFTDLPGSGVIRIYNIVGEQVAELNIAPGENPKSWNLVGSSGKMLASGVYIYLIDAGGEKTTGKLVVIR